MVENPGDYLKGSPADRNVWIILIVTGLIILFRRRVSWNEILASNRWLFIFFIYCAISILWSDYPFISFKRWLKDIGNVIMVLIILTEDDHVSALKAVFARCTYVFIPLSVIFIKYFPDIGRYYNRYTWEYSYCGVAVEKNGLGVIILVCGIFLVWDLIHILRADDKKTTMMDLLMRMILVIMGLWLIFMAKSKTSLVCMVLGICILLILYRPNAIKYIRNLGKYTLLLGLLVFICYAAPVILEKFVEILGRNITLTGRTDLWADLIKVPINPLFGTGYQSFWLGSRANHLWEIYRFHPNQAHNGFLETYLNGGIVGVSLLILMLVFVGRKLKHELMFGDKDGAAIRFSFFIVVLLSNWTEATFNRQSLIWIIMLIAALGFPLKFRAKFYIKSI